MQCILSDHPRFDIAYVYENSAVRDGLLYRISSFWAGQQGSLLLWALLIGLIGVPMAKKVGKASPLLMGFWCSVLSFLLVLLVVDDPMARLSAAQPATAGLGLNPLLKNPWMVIHPPVVFLGYALLCVPAAFAVQGIIEGDANLWARRCQPWALAGWTAMTAGLVLGMIWSYDVLGWGGYWGWDPVENASLVPWLLGTALIHGLVFQRVRNRNARWNMAMAFATFLSVLYAAYLTRSGILSEASVHSFGDGSSFRQMPIYPWLKWVPIGYAALCVGLLAVRRRLAPRGEAKPVETDSRDFALIVGVVVVCLFAAVVILGTTYTTFSTKAELKPAFYTRMSIPLTVAILALIALSPLLKWGGEKGRWRENLTLWSGIYALAIVAGIAIVVGAISASFPGAAHAFLGWLLPESSAHSRIVPFALVLMLGVAIVTLLASWVPIARSSLARCGAYLAHAGVALMIVGMIFSCAGRSKVLDLRVGGRSANAFGTSYSYDGTKPGRDGKEIIQLTARRNGKRLRIPLEMAKTRNGTIFFPYARSRFLSDLYIAPERIIADSVTPTMRLGNGEWIAVPARIPGDRASLAITGMTVELQQVTLEYMKAGEKPVKLVVGRDKPAKADGYTFSFVDFSGVGAHTGMPEQVGAVIGLHGKGFGETAVVRVSTKPLINLLWLGTLLIFTGGNLAWDRRREESAG